MLGSSALSNKISLRLLQDILSGTLEAGTHIGAQQIASRYDVSRTPVRDALEALEEKGILERQTNRGYFVAQDIPEFAREWVEDQPSKQGDDYQTLADDWLMDRIPEDVTEKFLRQRYDWTKSKLNDIMVRAFREGWVERKEGYGWKFQPVAKTPEAFDKIYRFRMTIEPAAMLEPTFELNSKVLENQHQVQSHMLESALEGYSDETILHNGSQFHEELIKLSQNPFYLSSLQNANRMRRLMEYQATVNRERVIEECTEHLEIIDLLKRREIVDASYLMRLHLSGALKRKSRIAWKRSNEEDI